VVSTAELLKRSEGVARAELQQRRPGLSGAAAEEAVEKERAILQKKR